MREEVSPDLHKARVKKIIKKGVAKMKNGETAVFPMSELIAEATNHLQATDEAKKRSP